MHKSTDEAQKVDRKEGAKYFAVYERIEAVEDEKGDWEEEALGLLM